MHIHLILKINGILIENRHCDNWMNLWCGSAKFESHPNQFTFILLHIFPQFMYTWRYCIIFTVFYNLISIAYAIVNSPFELFSTLTTPLLAYCNSIRSNRQSFISWPCQKCERQYSWLQYISNKNWISFKLFNLVHISIQLFTTDQCVHVKKYDESAFN